MRTGLTGWLIATVALALFNRPIRADIWQQGGFESSFGWTGSDTFMGQPATIGAAPGSATFFTLIGDRWITEPGTWVHAPGIAPEGNRMFWLRNYDDPDTICVGQRFTNSTAAHSALSPGQQYQLKWLFAAFAPDHPTGNPGLFSAPLMEIMTWNTAANAWDIFEQPITLSDGGFSDPNQGIFAQYAVGSWTNLIWIEATVNFTAPAATGQPVYLWVSMTNSSAGMLLDNIQLNAIPEPGAAQIGLLAALAMVATRRRGHREQVAG